VGESRTMKRTLCIHVTPSHMGMLTQFLLPSAVEFEQIVIYRSPQLGCSSFGGPGWGKNTQRKARSMQHAIESNDILVWADVDVVFVDRCYARLLELLDLADVACQDDGGGGFCTGFWIGRRNKRTREFFKRVAASDEFFSRPFDDNPKTWKTTDQAAANQYKDLVGLNILPKEEFWSPGFHGGKWESWMRKPSSVIDLPLPESVRVIHANYVWSTVEKEKVLSRFVAERSGRFPHDEHSQWKAPGV